MALFYLNITFILIAVLSVISSAAILYKNGSLLNKTGVSVIIFIYALLINFVNFTALASNYTFAKIIASLFILLSICSIIFKFLYKGNNTIFKFMILASIIGTTIQLFFFL